MTGLSAILTRIHLWCGVLFGVPIVIWMGVGVAMAWISKTEVSGRGNAPTIIARELEAAAYASPGGVIAQMGEAYSVSLRHFDGRPVYEAEGLNGAVLFDARTGLRLEFDEAQIRKIANRSFVGDAKITTLRELTVSPDDYAGRVPVWRAEFDDRLKTRLYISPQTGEVLARRNARWRQYELLKRLHVIQGDAPTLAHGVVIKIVGLGGLLFAISGLWLIFAPGNLRVIKNDMLRLVGRRPQN